MYRGYWKNDKKHGRGVEEYYDSKNDIRSIYDGLFENDKRHGYGTLKQLDPYNYKYEGYWDEGVKHGKGKEFDVKIVETLNS